MSLGLSSCRFREGDSRPEKICVFLYLVGFFWVLVVFLLVMVVFLLVLFGLLDLVVQVRSSMIITPLIVGSGTNRKKIPDHPQ